MLSAALLRKASAWSAWKFSHSLPMLKRRKLNIKAKVDSNYT